MIQYDVLRSTWEIAHSRVDGSESEEGLMKGVIFLLNHVILIGFNLSCGLSDNLLVVVLSDL